MKRLKRIADRVKEVDHFVLFIGNILYTEPNQNKRVSPEFVSYLEVSKRLMYYDDMQFGYINRDTFEKKELNHLDVDFGESTYTIIVYRRRNMRDKR